MLHEPAAVQQRDLAASYKSSLGVKMFVVYALVYASFVAINLLSPASMSAFVGLGLNLAVVYGFGLIIFALLLAVIYNQACNKREALLERDAVAAEAKSAEAKPAKPEIVKDANAADGEDD